MGLFTAIFGNKQKKMTFAQWATLTSYQPTFTNWNGQLYESMLVRTAIHAFATQASKLSIRILGSAQPTLTTQLLKAPNRFTTWSQFFYRAATILDAQNTVFIVPTVDEFGRTKAIHTVVPRRCEVKAFNDVPYLRYEFVTGEWAAVELSRVGMVTKFQYENEFFGESNDALRQTMQLIHLMDESIEEGTKQAATYSFMATLDNFARQEDLKREREKFTDENLTRGNFGLLLWPNTFKDVKQIEHKSFIVDAEQRKIIQANVYDYFGANEKIIRNECIGDAWNAYYEGKIEPFAVMLSQVLTKMLYSYTEQANGAAIIITANKLQYMSNKDKMNFAAQMGDRGFVTRNEIREVLQLPPLPPEIGDTLPVRGEYYNLGEREESSEEDEEQTDSDE